jgi:hypothetical protein
MIVTPYLIAKRGDTRIVGTTAEDINDDIEAIMSMTTRSNESIS